MPENGPKKDEKESQEDEMVRKKRRFHRCLGCMRDFNQRCWDMKLGKRKSVEMCTSNADMGVENVV